MKRKLFLLASMILALSSQAGTTPFTIENAKFKILSDGTVEITEFNHLSPPKISFSSGAKILSCAFRDRLCDFRDLKLIPVLNSTNNLKIGYEVNGKKNFLMVRALPRDLPRVVQDGKSNINKPLIFSTMSLHKKKVIQCHLFVLSPEGELRFYRKLDQVCFDFRPHEINGTTLYSYSEVRETILLTGYLGPRVILDASFREIDRLGEELEMHEFLYLGPKHWLGMEIELSRLSNGKPYINKRLRERKDGKILFDWGTSDIISQFGTEAATNMYQTEFRGESVAELFHLNSVQQLREDGLLLGLGHDGVAYLDKKSKKLQWVLGGIHDSFETPIRNSPLFNHTPHLDETTQTLHVFSNSSFGKVTERPCRMLRYKLDVGSKTIKEFKVLRMKDDVVKLLGSLQVHGDIMSIGFGSKESADWDFIETNEKGKDFWKLRLPKEWIVYRFYRSP